MTTTSSTTHYEVLIVGAGHAGVHAAATLAGPFRGSVALLSAEAREPYERPPLTKGFLTDEVAENELLIKPSSYWQSSGVTLVLDQRVVSVDAEEHLLETAGGQRFSYRFLIWSAGAQPLRLGLPVTELPGVHELRTLDDTKRFRGEVQPGTRVVVVGGGYVGLEAASACVKLGAAVTVLESRSRLLSRVTGTDVADYFLRRHRASGTRVELGASVTGIGERGGRVDSVHLDDGREIPAEVVLVCVGIRPAVDVLAAAGARCSNGVEVDRQGRTSLPDVYAAGDCTCFPIDGGGNVRLESLQNAVEQGEVAALSILGQEAVHDPVPYFWSNQFDIKLKTIGLFNGQDQSVRRQGVQPDSFSIVYLRDGRVCAVDSVNAMKDYVDARQVLGRSVSLDAVRDPAVRLRDSVQEDRPADASS